MSDTKILQAILDGQKALEERLTDKISDVGKQVAQVKSQVKNNGKRIDKLGLQIAGLEDDAPTIEEFDNLEKRVTKLESATT